MENWNKKTIEQKLDDLKGMVSGEEFFLIWSGEIWCAGYMITPGAIPEMDVSIEVTDESVLEFLMLCKHSLFIEVTDESVLGVLDKLHQEIAR